MREKEMHLPVIVTVTYDHTRQGLSVDYDPRGKFDRWMDEQLRELDACWEQKYPTFPLATADRETQRR